MFSMSQRNETIVVRAVVENLESRGEVPDSVTDRLSSHYAGVSQHVLFAG
jgi:hypothetical protein